MNFYNKHILPKLLNFTMRRRRFDSLRAEVVGESYGKVLEIGFGSGANIPYYKNVQELYALDPSEELFNLVTDTPHFVLTYVKANAEDIPFPDHTFDTVVSTWTICSVTNPERALSEIQRVLKTNGKFIFIEHGKSPHGIFYFLQKLFTPFSKKCAGNCHLDRDIPTLIKGSGFKEVHIEPITKGNLPLAHLYKGYAQV